MKAGLIEATCGRINPQIIGANLQDDDMIHQSSTYKVLPLSQRRVCPSLAA